MKPRRRDLEVFSLSFLDCICCGFGAIILLFVLSKFAEPMIIEDVRDDLESVIARLEEELFEIRGETVVLNRDLTAKKEQLAKNWRSFYRLEVANGTEEAKDQCRYKVSTQELCQ